MPTIPQRIAGAFAVLCGRYGDVTTMAREAAAARATSGYDEQVVQAGATVPVSELVAVIGRTARNLSEAVRFAASEPELHAAVLGPPETFREKSPQGSVGTCREFPREILFFSALVRYATL